MIMTILEYSGAALCILAQLQRSLNPKYIVLSFVTSSIAAIILSCYLILTQQYALLVVELVFIITNILGYFNWKKAEVKETCTKILKEKESLT